MSFTDTIKKNIGLIALIVLLGAGVYAFNLNNGLFWDDDDWIVGNNYVHDFSHLKEIFTKDVLSGFGLNSNYYRPFLLLTFAFNYAISGTDPFGYHLLSNAFHVFNAILAFLILLYVFRKKTISFFASMLFLLSPLQVEAVSYISGRGDPMSVFFMLLALAAFIRINVDSSKKVLYRTLGLASMILAVLSRETAILLPVLLVVFYVSFLSRDKFFKSLWQGIVKAIPFFAISGVYGILRLTVLNFQNTLNFYNASNVYADNLIYRIYTFFHVFLEYIRLIFVPTGLHMERDFSVHTSFFQWPVWLGFLAIMAIVAIGVILYRKEALSPKYLDGGLLGGPSAQAGKDRHISRKEMRKFQARGSEIASAGNGGLLGFKDRHWEISNFRIWFFGWSWFFVSLSMVSGIIPINAIIYEHWLYLPLIGFFALLAFYLDKLWGILQSCEGGRRLSAPGGYKGRLCAVMTWLFWLVVIGYLLFFAVQSIRRNLIWGNPIAFYEEIIRYNPGSIRILNNLGNIYSDKGRLDDAARIYEQIIADKNNIYPQPYYNLGNIYRDRGDREG